MRLNPFRRRRPVRINPAAHEYIRELRAFPAGTIEHMVGDNADLLGDEYLLEMTALIKKAHKFRSPVAKIGRRITALAMKK